MILNSTNIELYYKEATTAYIQSENANKQLLVYFEFQDASKERIACRRLCFEFSANLLAMWCGKSMDSCLEINSRTSII